MDENNVAVRIISSAGRSRINCKKTDTLFDLKKKIHTHLNIPIDKQFVYLDPLSKNLLYGDESTLSDLGIHNGDILHLKSDIVGIIRSAELEDPEKKKRSTKDLLPSACASNSSSSNLPSSSNDQKSNYSRNSSQSAGFHKTDTIEPTFSSFDAFIKERGYNVSDLPGLISYTSTMLEKGRMTKIPLSITLKHQAYRHVDHLELMNIDGVKNFVNYWRYDLGMCVQRGGFMYGYYIEDKHYTIGIRAVCECIYEAPQTISDKGTIQFLEDKKEKDIVEKIVNHLGLECIGWIFTHLPRDELLTADEVLQIAKMQLEHTTDKHFTGYPVSKFVTCTITPDAKTGGEPVPNAFMVSDLGMALVRDNVMAENQPDSSHIRLRVPKSGELLPQVLEAGQETTKFDVDWFVVRVNESAPIKVRSIFKQNHFLCENRQKEQKPSHLREYFSSVINSTTLSSRNKELNYVRFSDFHLLIYVAKLFDIETALSICDAIKNQHEVDPGLEDILKSMA